MKVQFYPAKGEVNIWKGGVSLLVVGKPQITLDYEVKIRVKAGGIAGWISNFLWKGHKRLNMRLKKCR